MSATLKTDPTGRAVPSPLSSLPRVNAFTLIELLVVISIIALLVAIILPSLGAAKEMAKRLQCSTRLKQLQLSLTVYAAENKEQFPPRSSAVRWPHVLRNEYLDPQILLCPTDQPDAATGGSDPNAPNDTAHRSYLINGWNDHFFVNYTPAQFNDYMAGTLQETMKERYIKLPSATIAFGEKITTSTHFYMDLLEGMGNDVDQVEQSRHGSARPNSRPGGSNYAFWDGHVQFRGFGEATNPINEWATTDLYRQQAIVFP